MFVQFEAWAGVLAGLISAACWARASMVKITRQQEVERRVREAAKTGETPNLAGATLDGWDMGATFAAQARWNAAGSACAALAIFAQAAGQFHGLTGG
jgi:hypothetical protein